MKFDALIICDAVTLRENLTHILGGGITRLWRPQLPAPASFMVAAVLELEREELMAPHEIVITVTHADSSAIVFGATGAFQAQQEPRLEPDETQLATIPFDFRNALLPTFGRYDLRATVDTDADTFTKSFWLLDPVEQSLPPIT